MMRYTLRQASMCSAACQLCLLHEPRRLQHAAHDEEYKKYVGKVHTVVRRDLKNAPAPSSFSIIRMQCVTLEYGLCATCGKEHALSSQGSVQHWPPEGIWD